MVRGICLCVCEEKERVRGGAVCLARVLALCLTRTA